MIRHYLLLPVVLLLLVVLFPELLLLSVVLFPELLFLFVVLFLELLLLFVVLFLLFVELPELDWVDSVFVLLPEADEELLPPEQAVMERASAPIIPTTKPFLTSSLTLNFLFIFIISPLSFSVLILLGRPLVSPDPPAVFQRISFPLMMFIMKEKA